MKKTIAMFAVLATLGLWSAYSSAGDEKAQEKSAGDAAQAAMMEAMMKQGRSRMSTRVVGLASVLLIVPTIARGAVL